MSIPESVIERVRFKNANTCESMEDAERRARRAFLALAGSLPESAVDTYIRAYWSMPSGIEIKMLFGSVAGLTNERARSRSALIAALKDIAGDSP